MKSIGGFMSLRVWQDYPLPTLSQRTLPNSTEGFGPNPFFMGAKEKAWMPQAGRIFASVVHSDRTPSCESIGFCIAFLRGPNE
jgi:hypothetical protein